MKINSPNRWQDVACPKIKKRFPDLVFKVAGKYIGKPKRMKALPRASSGNAKVYLIDKPFLVLKKSKSHKSRIVKMERARKICRENHYTHLIIPDARISDPFIVERRLPIIYQNTKEQIGCYIEHKELFTEAIEQFTKFLCQTELEDITWGMEPYQELSNSPIGRYDNVALYIIQGKGKLGLIDLEGFRPIRPDFKTSEQEVKWYFEQCRKAICLFPYHFDVIITAFKEFYPNIECYLQGLEKAKSDTIDFFQIVYENHVEFIKNKNITLENPSEPVVINVDKREELKRIIGSLVLQKGNDYEFLGKEPDKVISLFQEAFPEILGLVTELLSKEIQEKVNQQTVESLIKLVSCRTVRFNSRDLLDKVVHLLKTEYGNSYEKRDFARFIIDHIFKQLVQGQEIAHYEPYFGSDICVFC